MFGFCRIVYYGIYSNIFVGFIDSLTNAFELSRQDMTSLISIVLQIAVGVITYIGMLIILKDDYIYTFLRKVKNKLGKKKEA